MKTGNNTKKTKSEKEKIVLYLYTLLEKQEKILQKYLTLAEKETNIINTGDEEKLQQYKNLEKAFIKEAGVYAKVIRAFDTLYSESCTGHDQCIIDIKNRIHKLHSMLKSIQKENTEALLKQIGALKKELDILSKKKRKKPSPFREIGKPSYIDIKI